MNALAWIFAGVGFVLWTGLCLGIGFLKGHHRTIEDRHVPQRPANRQPITPFPAGIDKGDLR